MFNMEKRYRNKIIIIIIIIIVIIIIIIIIIMCECARMHTCSHSQSLSVSLSHAHMHAHTQHMSANILSLLLFMVHYSVIEYLCVQDGVPFLRLGRSSRIHPDILDHAAETLTLDITSVDSLRDFYASDVSTTRLSNEFTEVKFFCVGRFPAIWNHVPAYTHKQTQ